MVNGKKRFILTAILILLFTTGFVISALAETVDTPAETNPASSTVSTAADLTSTTSNAAATTDVPSIAPTEKNAAKTKLQQIRQKVNQIREQEHQLQKEQKKLQKMLPDAEFKKLLKEEVLSKDKGKKNMVNARQGIVLKIEAAANGKTNLFIRRGDVSKVYNNYFSANIDPAKTVVYDRTLKAQKSLADITVGDVVRVMPVRGASLVLIEKIGHREVNPPSTTADTLPVTN